ncbi:hypothetical protein [Azospira sp. I09]|uniref:hypothetical protein n=1 Tax=Azospira sp. I09 TaxID=1765049 RepID=UPI001561C15E|nr:hypothetical protein [Azospira sp. I09]
MLQVLSLETEAIRRLGPNADIFVTHRAWDQRLEHGQIVASIERQFGILVSHILNGREHRMDPGAFETISRMYSLWRIRHHRAKNSLPDAYIGTPERVVLNRVMDEGEHYGMISITADGFIPGRMMAGPLMLLALDRQAEALAGKRWGIIHAKEGEFVLPDSFGDFMIMPISPTCCLVADEDDGSVGIEGVSQINGFAIAHASSYLAARDLAECPGLEKECLNSSYCCSS